MHEHYLPAGKYGMKLVIPVVSNQGSTVYEAVYKMHMYLNKEREQSKLSNIGRRI